MPSKTENRPLDQGKALTGVLAMLVADREERLSGDAAAERRTEVLLAAAGLTAGEIAPLVGKSNDAVQKAIQRGRRKPKPKKKRL